MSLEKLGYAFQFWSVSVNWLAVASAAMAILSLCAALLIIKILANAIHSNDEPAWLRQEVIQKASLELFGCLIFLSVAVGSLLYQLGVI